MTGIVYCVDSAHFSSRPPSARRSQPGSGLLARDLFQLVWGSLQAEVRRAVLGSIVTVASVLPRPEFMQLLVSDKGFGTAWHERSLPGTCLGHPRICCWRRTHTIAYFIVERGLLRAWTVQLENGTMLFRFDGSFALSVTVRRPVSKGTVILLSGCSGTCCKQSVSPRNYKLHGDVAFSTEPGTNLQFQAY
jgi:hypothetical protein